MNISYKEEKALINVLGFVINSSFIIGGIILLGSLSYGIYKIVELF